jgi:hypothetical protein
MNSAFMSFPQCALAQRPSAAVAWPRWCITNNPGAPGWAHTPAATLPTMPRPGLIHRHKTCNRAMAQRPSSAAGRAADRPLQPVVGRTTRDSIKCCVQMTEESRLL